MTCGDGFLHAQHGLDVGERVVVRLRGAEAALLDVLGAVAVGLDEHAFLAQEPVGAEFAVQEDVRSDARRELEGLELEELEFVDRHARHRVENDVRASLADASDTDHRGVLHDFGSRSGEADVEGGLDVVVLVRLCAGIRLEVSRVLWRAYVSRAWLG